MEAVTGVEARDELGRMVLARVLIARDAGVEEARGVAGVAGVEVVEARGELGLERVEARELRSRVGETRAVGVAHQAHRTGRARRLFPRLHDRLNLREREAEILELADPPDADERVVSEEAIATLRSGMGTEEAELLVEVNRANRLPRRLGEIADLEELVARVVAHFVAGNRKKSFRALDGGGNREAETGFGHRSYPCGRESHLTLTHGGVLCNLSLRGPTECVNAEIGVPHVAWKRGPAW